MAIDSRYLASSSLEQYLVDKDTGFPLSGGLVYFWQDNNRSTPKTVYKLSGSPPNYNFVALPNPVVLGSNGVPTDGSGNNVVIYYFPYDSNGNLQLYFVSVQSSQNVPQYTLQAWPPQAVQQAANDQNDSTLNLIPNGQFLLHDNIPVDIINSVPAGQITTPITVIAQGGWTFERPRTSTAIDNVSFSRYIAYTTNPSSSPRYAVQVTTNGGSPSDAFKDIRIKFDDVNKFASSTQQYTIFFSAISVSGGSFPLNLNFIKYYGTGGSTTQTINVQTFTITPVQQNFSANIIFGSNAGKNIGLLDNDYTQIAFSLPTNANLTFSMTDVVMVIGDVDVTEFPITTNKDFIVRSLATMTPDYNGYDLGLPIIFNQGGLDFDTSQIGKVYQTVSYQPAFGELNCDGKQYRSDAYSTDGIPYRRLRNVLVTTPTSTTLGIENIPIFGTGVNYVTATHITSGNFFLSQNKAGIPPAVTDGSGGNATGFTFNVVSPGAASSSYLGFTSYLTGLDGDEYWVFCNDIGAISSTRPNFSSTVTQTLNDFPNTQMGEIVGSDFANQVIQVSSNNDPEAGSYLQIQNPNRTIVAWFTNNGSGTAPSVPGARLFQINTFSNFDSHDAAYAISQSLSGFQITAIATVSGSSLTPNSYFTFVANGQLYYVWYSLNGNGTDPLVAGGIGIVVPYSTADGANTVKINTVVAINDLYFAVPDLRGWTIKGWDPTHVEDQNYLLRFSLSQNRYENVAGLPQYIGSYQNNALFNHTHIPDVQSFSGSSTSFPPGTGTTVPINSIAASFYIGNSGTPQNDVKNVYLNYVIKY